MVLLGCPLFTAFIGIDLLRAVSENTALVVGGVEFGAIRADATAHAKEEFCSKQHAEGEGKEINPKGMPIPASKCRAKGSRGIHAHSEEGRFERDKNRIERTDKIWRVARK